MMGELFEMDNDPCMSLDATLSPFASCAGAGLDEYDLCGGNSMCLSLGSYTNACIDVCVPTTAEPYGTVGHADCRDGSTTCTEVGFSDFGACLP